MLIGYARVSAQDQNLELQRNALTKAGCEKVCEDKVSGTRAERPGLDKALDMLREGDTLVVWKLDRLGRSVKHLVGLEAAKQRGRKPKMADSKIESAKKLLASGVPPKDVARNLGVSVPTLYRWVAASASTHVRKE